MFPPVVHRLAGPIETSFSGYNQLAKFYHFCLGHPSQTLITLDFKEVDWFDGNLCALLGAICMKLNKDHGQTFHIAEEQIKDRFDILFRNGFLRTENPVTDNRQSTVPFQLFATQDKEGFCQYVENELLEHRGIRTALNDDLKEQICEDLLEIFSNTHLHANTQDPFFVGGQFYPRQKCLRFTMVDLGDGFLPRITKATQGQITSDLAAIKWAVAGNSSKWPLERCPGGLGLQNIFSYCIEHQGVLQIISGSGFWSSDLEGTIFAGGRTTTTPLVGSTINLFFKTP